MKMAKLSEIRDYWKSKGIFHMKWFASIKSRGPFEEINRCLHLANNKKLSITFTNWEYYHMNLVYEFYQSTYQNETCQYVNK